MHSQLLAGEREASLERFRATRSGRDKPSRYWKYDLESLDWLGNDGMNGLAANVRGNAERGQDDSGHEQQANEPQFYPSSLRTSP